MRVPNFVPLFCLVLIFVLAGCNFPGLGTQQAGATTPSLPELQTLAAATLAAQPQETVTAQDTTLLSRSVYFLSHRSGSVQIWRLGSDGVTLEQITEENGEVDSFDVSAVDGRVAYVTNNQLYLVADVQERILLVDNAAANRHAADFYFRQRIGSPRFSPDGRYLAYALDGLRILDLSTNESVHLLANQVEREDGTPDKFFAPLEWAPNSLQLLLEIGYREAGTMAVLNPGADPLVTEFETAIVCCQAVWAPDSRSILVASPYLGLVDAGLWRYDALTGESTTLFVPTGLYEFAGWPLQLPSGELLYFYSSSAEIPDGDVALYMVRSAADGVSGRIQLRPDAFSVREALWAKDGSFALIMSANPGSLSGPVVMALSDGSQLHQLLDEAWNLRWGP